MVHSDIPEPTEVKLKGKKSLKKTIYRYVANRGFRKLLSWISTGVKLQIRGLQILPFVLLCLVILSLIEPVQGSRNYKMDSRQRARHFYMEGARMEAEGNMPASYEFYKRAYQADSTYPEGCYTYGMLRLGIPLDEPGDDKEALRSLKISSEMIKKYPGDFFTSSSYGYAAAMLDTLKEAIRVFETLDSLYPSKTLNLLYLGDIYMRAGEKDKAIDALNKYERIEGVSPALTLRKVSYHLHVLDTTGALEEVSRLLETKPRTAELLTLKGKVFEFVENPDSAFTYYQEAQKLDSTSGDIKQSLARIYLLRGDSVAYDTKMLESLLCDDLELEDKLQLTASYLQKIINEKSDTRRGDRIFLTLQSQYPHEPEILALSARYNAAKGNLKKAIEDVSYAIDLDRQNEELWSNKMLYEMNERDFTAAMNTFFEADTVLEGETSRGIRILFATSAQEAGKIDTAVETYAGLIKDIVPELELNDTLTDKKPYQNLDFTAVSYLSVYYQMAGDVYYSAKRLDEGFRCYENALFFNPDNDAALNNYAYGLVDDAGVQPGSELFEKAKNMSRKVIDHQPNNTTYLDTYAWILFREGNFEEARDYQQAAVELMKEEGSENVDFYSHLGDILFKCGDEEGALENWKKALELAPDDELIKKKINKRQYFEK